ncbi:hypothetical protein LCGC14_2883890, partial [marine sediment metagenome]
MTSRLRKEIALELAHVIDPVADWTWLHKDIRDRYL